MFEILRSTSILNHYLLLGLSLTLYWIQEDSSCINVTKESYQLSNVAMGDEIPFDCEDAFYQTITSNGQSALVKYNSLEASIFDIALDTIATFDFEVNSAGFNPIDNYIYCLSISSDLIRLHADGSYTNLGNLDIASNTYVGDFTSSGEFYIRGTDSIAYVVDVNTLSLIHI